MQHEKTVSHLSQKRFLQIAKASLAARFFGLWAGIAGAGAAASVWAWADIAAGHIYANPWIIYVNAGSRLVFFLLVALAVGYIVTTLRRPRSQSRPFFGELPVCTGRNKIRDHDGYWWDVPAYLWKYSGEVPRAKRCPDCAHEAYAVQAASSEPISR